MTKFKIADLPEADYNLRDSIERKFRGQVKFESTEQSLNTLFWYPPSGLGGWYTTELVKAFVDGYQAKPPVYARRSSRQSSWYGTD